MCGKIGNEEVANVAVRAAKERSSPNQIDEMALADLNSAPPHTIVSEPSGTPGFRYFSYNETVRQKKPMYKPHKTICLVFVSKNHLLLDIFRSTNIRETPRRCPVDIRAVSRTE